jgi:hypothetical protein
MARPLVLTLSHRGLDQCLASFASASEAASNAHDELIELEFSDGAIRFQGMALVDMGEPRIEGWTVICDVKPTAAMILFASWFMSMLPSRARVTWSNGWPLFYCPPNDDRDGEDGPTPLVPDELVLA